MPSALLTIVISFITTIQATIKSGLHEYYPEYYNLIDTAPSCIERGLCPHISIGDLNSIHPNNKERTEYLLRNWARLYPDEYLTTPYGNQQYGTWGGTYDYACEAEQQSMPFYWLSESNQVTRAHSYWNLKCTYKAPTLGCSEDDAGETTCTSTNAHRTCDEFCYIMEPFIDAGDDPCAYGSRNHAFCDMLYYDLTATASTLGVYTGSEGIWDVNSGYTSEGHCGLPFNPDYRHIGIGYWPGEDLDSGGNMAMVGVKVTDGLGEDHVFPFGIHFDEEWRVPEDYHDPDGKRLTFLVQFFGGLQSPAVTADTVWLLYDAQNIEMELVTGDVGSGFYRVQYDPAGLTSCRPYAFVAKDNNGNYWRLPEQDIYFFGTYHDPRLEVPGGCDENHYYHNGDEWTANAGPKVDGKSSCIGCDYIPPLETKWKELLGPTPAPTPAPTFSPSITAYDYILVTDRSLNWEEANAECYDRYGSELATIYDDQSARILLYIAGKREVWIGLNDIEEEGVWTHPDGENCGGTCKDLSYWMINDDGTQDPDNKWNGQHAAIVYGWNGDQTDFNTDIDNMLADAKPEMEKNFICNPARTKYPTPVTSSPTTQQPTAPTIQISDDYILVEEQLTYDDANERCYELYGSELASVSFDDELATKLLELAEGNRVWIGLNDYTEEGSWVNADGSLCGYDNCVDLPYWQEYEPNNQFSDQHAGYIDGGIAQGDISNMLADTRGYYNEYYFICNAVRTKAPTSTPAPTTEKQDYILVQERLSWSDARDRCMELYGTTLANIYHSDQLMERLLELADDKGTWVGLNDIAEDHDWVNLDGTRCGDTACIDLPYWMEGEPDNLWNWHDVAWIDAWNARGDINNMLGDLPDASHKLQDQFICNGIESGGLTDDKGSEDTSKGDKGGTITVVVLVSLVLIVIAFVFVLVFCAFRRGLCKRGNKVVTFEEDVDVSTEMANVDEDSEAEDINETQTMN